jgi:hypothetical protein
MDWSSQSRPYVYERAEILPTGHRASHYVAGPSTDYPERSSPSFRALSRCFQPRTASIATLPSTIAAPDGNSKSRDLPACQRLARAEAFGRSTRS